jgi:hypothetical protein
MSAADGPRLSKPHTYAGRLQRLVLQVLLDHEAADEIPTNGRFIFYELEQQGHVSKPVAGKRYGSAGEYSEQNVINALIYLRDQGVIPWDWIEDETRHFDEWEHATSVAEFVKNQIPYARINPWPGEPPLLLVESRSLGGVLRAMTGDYLVGIAATNGQARGFLHTKVGPALRRNERPVLYLGDRDPQGDDIEANTRRVLEKVSGRSLDWTRIAITEEQIRERPEITSRTKLDKRFKPAREYQAWEAEALGQGTIQRLVRDALDDLLPEPLESVLEKERRQRQRVAELLREWST